MKKILSVLVLSFCLLFIGVTLLAQSSPPPAAPPAASVAAPSPASGFLAHTGGIAGAVSFIVFGMFTLLSAIRLVIAKYDGVNPGENKSDPDAKLTFLNVALIWLGKAMDLFMGNPQH